MCDLGLRGVVGRLWAEDEDGVGGDGWRGCRRNEC